MGATDLHQRTASIVFLMRIEMCTATEYVIRTMALMTVPCSLATRVNVILSVEMGAMVHLQGIVPRVERTRTSLMESVSARSTGMDLAAKNGNTWASVIPNATNVLERPLPTAYPALSMQYGQSTAVNATHIGKAPIALSSNTKELATPSATDA